MTTLAVPAATLVGPEALPVELARALGDPLRWRIVELLGTEQLCVAHLAEEPGTTQPLVSHHLKVLREDGLIEPDRYRYWTYYRLWFDALIRLAANLGMLACSARAAPPAAASFPCGSRFVDPSPAPRPRRPRHASTGHVSTFSRAKPSPARSSRWPRSSAASTRWRPSNASWMSPSTVMAGARVVDFIPLFVHRFA